MEAPKKSVGDASIVPETQSGPQNVRLFVGGVPHGTTQSELEARFGRYGKVSDVEVVHYADGLEKTFAYVTLQEIAPSALMKLRATYNNSRWKGSVLRLQKAKVNCLCSAFEFQFVLSYSRS